MMGELYDALRSAGADDEKARRAASEIASYDNQLAGLRTEMVSLRGDFALVKWMLGFNIAMTVALVGKAFLASH